jgi:hypothetical protein
MAALETGNDGQSSAQAEIDNVFKKAAFALASDLAGRRMGNPDAGKNASPDDAGARSPW